jgi:membrane fusion protein, multidrug efflux system
MKNFPNWLIILVMIGLLIVSKFLFFAKKDDKGGAAAKNKMAMPVAVNYTLVKKSGFSNAVFATGRVGAMNEVNLLPEIAGKVVAIYFKEGETVTKGSALVKLNDADLQAQLTKNKLQSKLSAQKLERVKKLLDIKGISQEEYDMQENELATLKAEESYLITQVAKTTLVAPFSGVIGLKNISEGAFVNANTPIVSLVQLQPLFIEFSLPEKYTELIKKGVTVNFSADNVETKNTYSAQVYAIEPRVDETTKTIRARALYSGNQAFYPGSFVNVFVNLQKNEDAIMVPTQCVIPTLKGQKVFICKHGLATEVMIKTGVRTDQTIQIIEGLTLGDTLLTTGLMSVKKESKLKLLKKIE